MRKQIMRQSNRTLLKHPTFCRRHRARGTYSRIRKQHLETAAGVLVAQLGGDHRPLGTSTVCSSQAELSEVFFDRLLECIDPHREQDAQSPQEKIICGRWLALRRLRSGLTSEQVARRAGLTPASLLLLEAGLADEPDSSVDVWGRLAAIIADPQYDATFIAGVIDIGLGRLNPSKTEILKLVEVDLDRLTQPAGHPEARENGPDLPVATGSFPCGRQHGPGKPVAARGRRQQRWFPVKKVPLLAALLINIVMFSIYALLSPVEVFQRLPEPQSNEYSKPVPSRPHFGSRVDSPICEALRRSFECRKQFELWYSYFCRYQPFNDPSRLASLQLPPLLIYLPELPQNLKQPPLDDCFSPPIYLPH